MDLAPNYPTLRERFGTMYRITRRRALIAGATVVVAASGIVGGASLGHTRAVTTTTTTPQTGTANLFQVATGGDPNCTPHAQPIDYQTALTTTPSPICGASSTESAWDRACQRAATRANPNGNDILVMPGNYPGVNGQGAMQSSVNCSGSFGAAVNPDCVDQNNDLPGQCTSTGTIAGWARWRCGVNDGTKNVTTYTDDVNLPAFSILHKTSYISIRGGCFNLGSVLVGAGGDASATRTLEVQISGDAGCATNPASTDCMYTQGLETAGGKDVLFQNINHGPFLQCFKNDSLATVPWQRCDPSVYFEAALANYGSITGTCNTTTNGDTAGVCGGYWGYKGGAYRLQDYIHFGAQHQYENVRLQNVYEHDTNAVVNGVHVGCLQTGEGDPTLEGSPVDNLVMDHIICERFTGTNLQISNDGVTLQNSLIWCPGGQGQNTGGVLLWDTCAPFAGSGPSCKYDTGTGAPRCNQSDVYIRFNDFLGSSSNSMVVMQESAPSCVGQCYGTHSSIYIIGNLSQMSGPAGCSFTGVTCDRNAYVSGISQVGSNPVSLSCADPFISSGLTTTGHQWQQVVTSDLHFSGACSVSTFDATSLAAQYKLGFDADGNPRTLNAMRYGAYN